MASARRETHRGRSEHDGYRSAFGVGARQTQGRSTRPTRCSRRASDVGPRRERRAVATGGFTGSNWRSSMRRGPAGRRRNPPPTGPRLSPRPDQLTVGAYVRRSSRSVWSGIRPGMSQGAWRPPVVGPSFNPLLPKQFLVHARDHVLQGRVRRLRLAGLKDHKEAAPAQGGELRPPCSVCRGRPGTLLIWFCDQSGTIKLRFRAGRDSGITGPEGRSLPSRDALLLAGGSDAVD
jgi:hypothetical protein